MTSSPRQLRNFVNGEYVEARTDATSDIVSPVTGQVVAKAPVSTAADVDAAYAAASRAFEEWGQTTPSERQQALLKFADAIETRADEFVQLEAENTGKPYALTASEELPPMVDQLRFFAGAARVLEGRAAGEYMRGPHQLGPPRAHRRRRPGDAVELPDDDGRLEDRAGPGGRQHHRPQAVRHHARDDPAAGRDRLRVPPRRHVQRRDRRP